MHFVFCFQSLLCDYKRLINVHLIKSLEKKFLQSFSSFFDSLIKRFLIFIIFAYDGFNASVQSATSGHLSQIKYHFVTSYFEYYDV